MRSLSRYIVLREELSISIVETILQHFRFLQEVERSGYRLQSGR